MKDGYCKELSFLILIPQVVTSKESTKIKFWILQVDEPDQLCMLEMIESDEFKLELTIKQGWEINYITTNDMDDKVVMFF